MDWSTLVWIDRWCLLVAVFYEFFYVYMKKDWSLFKKVIWYKLQELNILSLKLLQMILFPVSFSILEIKAVVNDKVNWSFPEMSEFLYRKKGPTQVRHLSIRLLAQGYTWHRQNIDVRKEFSPVVTLGVQWDSLEDQLSDIDLCSFHYPSPQKTVSINE